jgi:hypothetical protein
VIRSPSSSAADATPNTGTSNENGRQGRDHPNRREQQRRQLVEAHLDHDEVHAPDRGEAERQQQVTVRHPGGHTATITALLMKDK